MNAASYAHEDPVLAVSHDEARREEVDALADTIAVSAARIDAATHELCSTIRRFDELGGWAWQGAKSCAAWLSWRIGLGVGTAGEKVRVARALGELPRIDAAFAAGELSYCKVRAMTRVATEATEELLLEMAKCATGAQLEQICRGLRRVERAAAADEAARRRAAGPDRWIQRRHQPDGMVRIEMQLLPDEAELVWQALAEVRAELVADAGGDAAGADVGAKMADDVVAEQSAAERALAEDGPAQSAAGRAPDLSAESDAGLAGAEAEGESGAPSLSEWAVSPSDPLAHLFAPEPEPTGPRGYWDRCEDTGELVYYGSDPPEIWPEDGMEAPEGGQSWDGRRILPSRAELAAKRAGELPDLADAMVALAERSLAATMEEGVGGAGRARARTRRRGQRPLLLVHLSEDRLAQALDARGDGASRPVGAEGEGTTSNVSSPVPVPFVAELHGGGWLGGDSLLRLACDGAVVVVKTDGRGNVLDVGRRQRTIPPAILRALFARDRHCQFPGCSAQAWIEAHHVDHWAHGGETRLDNLLCICHRHHAAVHEGGCRVEKGEDGGAPRFFDASGRLLEAAPRPAPTAAGPVALEEIACEQESHGVVIDRVTALPHWDGTPADLGAAVSALWRRIERASQRVGELEHRGCCPVLGQPSTADVDW